MKLDKQENFPLVSICVITYNHEKYIKQAVDSILCQQMNFTYELLIADDASTDRTQQILRENYSNIENVRLILREKNAMGMNGYMTFREAKGKYIYLCEGDDYCVGEDSIQTLVDWLECHEQYAGVCGRRVTLSEKTGSKFIAYDKSLDNKEVKLDDFLSNRIIFDMCAILYRNFYHDGKYDYRYYLASRKVSDVSRAIYVLLHGNVFQLDKIVGVYRTDRIKGARSYNTMTTPKKNFEEHIRLLSKLVQLIGADLDCSGLRRRYTEHYIATLGSTFELIRNVPYLIKIVGKKITLEFIIKQLRNDIKKIGGIIMLFETFSEKEKTDSNE